MEKPRKDGRRKCKNPRCNKVFTPRVFPKGFKNSQWRRFLLSFAKGNTEAAIAHALKTKRDKISRMCVMLRGQIHMENLGTIIHLPKDVARVEADEFYIRRQRRGYKGAIPSVVAELYNDGRVLAAVIPRRDSELDSVGWSICKWTTYDALDFKKGTHHHGLPDLRDVRRLVEELKAVYPIRPRRPDGLWTFRNYLFQWLRRRRGIAWKLLGLHVAEIVWRYNHRDYSAEELVPLLQKMIRRDQPVTTPRRGRDVVLSRGSESRKGAQSRRRRP